MEKKNIPHVKPYPELVKVPSFTRNFEIYVCSYASVANSLPQWRHRSNQMHNLCKYAFVEFHRYWIGSQTVVIRNDSEKNIFKVGIYQLRLRG